MKNYSILFFITFLVVIDHNLFSQDIQFNKLKSQLFFDSNNKITLPTLVINPADSFVIEVMNKTPELQRFVDTDHYYKTVLKNSTFYTDLNGDGKMDMLIIY